MTIFVLGITNNECSHACNFNGVGHLNLSSSMLSQMIAVYIADYSFMLVHNIKLFISFPSVYLYLTVNDGLHEASFIGQLIFLTIKFLTFENSCVQVLIRCLGKREFSAALDGNVHHILVSMTQFFYWGLQPGKVDLTMFARCCFFKCLVEEGMDRFFLMLTTRLTFVIFISEMSFCQKLYPVSNARFQSYHLDLLHFLSNKIFGSLTGTLVYWKFVILFCSICPWRPGFSPHQAERDSYANSEAQSRLQLAFICLHCRPQMYINYSKRV